MIDEQVEREAAMAAEAGKTTASQPGKGTDAPPPVPPNPRMPPWRRPV